MKAELDLGVDLPKVWERVHPWVRPTTFIRSERLDRRVGAKVLLVSETFQHTGSFKMRAAVGAVLHKTAPRFITGSSGNFGAALACACARASRSCVVVMPQTSAQVKVAAVRSNGARVDLIDTTRVTRAARVAELAAKESGTQVVSPYDDPHVVAGNSSLGAELFRGSSPECVVVPVGGGGLASGLILARDRLASCEVIGAEPAIANDAARSLREGRLLANPSEPPTVCDGARTLSLGQLNFAILQAGLAGVMEVDEANVLLALRLLFMEANLKAEPTGALALAALLQAPERFAGREVACIVSGANVDVEAFASWVT